MAVTLRERQSLFVHLIGKLIEFATDQGFELTFGEAHRPPEMAALYKLRGTGIGNSLHTVRLAIDLNLFMDGEFQADSAAHLPLGAFWKLLHTDCRWGGDFAKPDGNHYSLAYEERA